MRTVYDLRLFREQEAAPDRLPPGTRHVPCDVLSAWTEGGPAQVFAWFEDPAAACTALAGGRAEALWVEQYRAFVHLPSARAAYGAILRDLARDGSRPGLVHCTTGKDRTGWIVGVLQLFLGVPEDAVIAHYLESRERIASLVAPALAGFAARGGDPELLRPIFDVRHRYLLAGIAEARATWGSIERYVADGLGVDEAARDALRRAFLTSN